MTRRTLLFYLISLLFFSCKKEEKLTFSEIQITTKNNTIVEVFIPKASGNKLASESINEEIERFVAATLVVGKTKINSQASSITKQIETFNEEYTNFTKDFPEASQIFQSTEIVSIAITSYLNTGGAHGNTSISFLNFDTATGKRILNENLFTDIEAFKHIAKTYFDEEVKDKTILFESESYTLPENIGFSEEGLILLYNTYEIAPYVTGIIEFTIPFEKANDYLVFDSLQ